MEEGGTEAKKTDLVRSLPSSLKDSWLRSMFSLLYFKARKETPQNWDCFPGGTLSLGRLPVRDQAPRCVMRPAGRGQGWGLAGHQHTRTRGAEAQAAQELFRECSPPSLTCEKPCSDPWLLVM